MTLYQQQLTNSEVEDKKQNSYFWYDNFPSDPYFAWKILPFHSINHEWFSWRKHISELWCINLGPFLLLIPCSSISHQFARHFVRCNNVIQVVESPATGNSLMGFCAQNFELSFMCVQSFRATRFSQRRVFLCVACVFSCVEWMHLSQMPHSALLLLFRSGCDDATTFVRWFFWVLFSGDVVRVVLCWRPCSLRRFAGGNLLATAVCLDDVVSSSTLSSRVFGTY